MSGTKQRVTARVHGRVQGVGFRWFVRRAARSLDLSGWVRNEADGTVTLEAEGPPERLDDLIGQVRTGPPGSRVDRVDSRRMQPAGDTAPFDIR